MKIPKRPPPFMDLMAKIDIKSVLPRLAGVKSESDEYHHWDKLRHLKPPGDLSREEWWLGLKLRRISASKPVGLRDVGGSLFHFSVPDRISQLLHRIDLGAAGAISVPEPIVNPHTRDRYVVSSLMEEAITSSQLEGAVTTREVAKEMIRFGRSPRDTSEQMILNNFVTMRKIGQLKNEKLSPQMVFEIHRLITEKTLDDGSGAGRFREFGEEVVVGDDFGEVFHTPPSAAELSDRMDAMCQFANGDAPDYFVHPVVRAILLHFWLAYDHPFVDGNGRTARALFYWSMLRAGYWLFEFISISSVLHKAPARYARSFLYTETDDNDLTYFLLYHTNVIHRAIEELHDYLERKNHEYRAMEARVRELEKFNPRQVALLRHALTHPGYRYTIESHRKSHGVAYQTARTDLLNLQEGGVLRLVKRGKLMVFISPADLSEILTTMNREDSDSAET